jgi:protein-S-isoprenylcysteine O-methyltransferase Ste14
MATILRLLLAIFAQWIVIFYPGVLVFWLIVHTNIERLRTVGPRVYWAVAVVAWTATAGPLMLFRRQVFSVRFMMPDGAVVGIAVLGALALVIAARLLSQALTQIPFRTMVGLPEIEPHKSKQPLLNTGIYSKTRNPIYLAHWLLVLSAAALTNFAANWLMFAADCVVLPLLIRAEERELLRRYGTVYQSYMRQVPRFFPQVR